MSKKKVSSPRNQRSSGVKRRKSSRKPVAEPNSFDASLKRHHYFGIALGGGKSDKTCVALVEYYPTQNKIFLSQVSDKIKSVGNVSGDQFLFEEISRHPHPIESVAFNAPLTMPKCTTCQLKCPGYENCNVEEIQWMWQHRQRHMKSKKTLKLFTPYTERCVEQWIASEIEEPLQPQNAFGANMAPLYARARFINRRLGLPAIEVFPKLSLWRIGRSLQIQKSYLRFHKHSIGGDEARLAILQALVARNIAFLYEQDVRLMVKSAQAFDAFICALTAVLKTKGQCIDRPKHFPEEEGWIEIPKQDILWE